MQVFVILKILTVKTSCNFYTLGFTNTKKFLLELIWQKLSLRHYKETFKVRWFTSAFYFVIIDIGSQRRLMYIAWCHQHYWQRSQSCYQNIPKLMLSFLWLAIDVPPYKWKGSTYVNYCSTFHSYYVMILTRKNMLVVAILELLFVKGLFLHI